MKSFSDLQKRVLVALVYFPLLLLSCFDSKFFALSMLLVSGFAWHEYLKFWQSPRKQDEWIKHGCLIVLGSLPALTQVAGHSFVVGFAFQILAVQVQLVKTLAETSQWEKSLQSLKTILFGLVYISGTTSMLMWCQQKGGHSALLFLFLVVAAADTGAYFGGRFFGKTPFFQEMSPKKTQEGFWWGLGLSIFVGVVFNLALKQYSHEVPGVIASAALSWGVALASVFGDLFESAMKRHFGVKDSGQVFPGHGGVLDRFDGVLFAVVPLFFYIALFDGFK